MAKEGSRLPSLLMAWRNLWRNRLRTILAALGIVIGVLAIAGLGITGTALRYGATQQFQEVTDQVTVTAGEDAEHRRLSEAQVLNISRVASNATVIPIKTARTTVGSRVARERVRVEQVTHPRELYEARYGEIPERFRTGVLIDSSIARRLEVGIGDRVIVGDRSFEVRAILSDGGVGFRSAEVVVSPPAVRHRGYSAVRIVAEDGDAAQALANATADHFNSEDEEIVRTDSYGGLNDRVGNLFSTMNLVLMGIGSISLFVAAVSILNVMLMSIVERRNEIGVLRAVGVRRSEILRMILSEAMLLGVLGGIVGALLSGAIGSLLYSELYQDPTLFLRWSALRYLLVGFAFGAFASVLSGLYPAWKAANEPPVEALRG